MMCGLKIFQLKLSSLLFFFIIFSSGFSIAQNNVSNALKEAYKTKNIDTLNQFIQTYKTETKYVEEAIRIRDQIAFDKAKEINTIEAYQEYINNYPQALQVSQAKQWIKINSQKAKIKDEENDYDLAKKENTLESFTSFINTVS